jgi:hypothetical protein
MQVHRPFKSKVKRLKAAPRTLPYPAAIDRIRDGAVLVHMHGKEGERRWFVVPGGAVTDETAARITEHPQVRSGHDGLFPQHDQTWRMVSP